MRAASIVQCAADTPPCSAAATLRSSQRPVTKVLAPQSVLSSTHPATDAARSRRQALHAAAAAAAASLLLGQRPALANPLEDLTRLVVRPELAPDQAVVNLMDARSVLLEIKVLASTSADSPSRQASQSLLPGYAKYLRGVGPATPVVAALAGGTDKEATLSEQYGGSGQDSSLAVPVYVAVGQILNYSGRGLREEVLQGPELASAAIASIDDLLAQVPPPMLERAQRLREQRTVALRK